MPLRSASLLHVLPWKVCVWKGEAVPCKEADPGTLCLQTRDKHVVAEASVWACGLGPQSKKKMCIYSIYFLLKHLWVSFIMVSEFLCSLYVRGLHKRKVTRFKENQGSQTHSTHALVTSMHELCLCQTSLYQEIRARGSMGRLQSRQLMCPQTLLSWPTLSWDRKDMNPEGNVERFIVHSST